MSSRADGRLVVQLDFRDEEPRVSARALIVAVAFGRDGAAGAHRRTCANGLDRPHRGQQRQVRRRVPHQALDGVAPRCRDFAVAAVVRIHQSDRASADDNGDDERGEIAWKRRERRRRLRWA